MGARRHCCGPTPSGMKTIRVLLVDDHKLVRAGFRALLQSLPSVEVVAEASDGREALNLIGQHAPDVVLIDIGMAGLNGLEAAARIRKNFARVRVVILSMHANEEYVVQALRTGASGYLLKDAATTELDLALRAVVRGESYLSPAISKKVTDSYLARVEAGPTASEQLTPRQREILQLIAEGNSSKDIAVVLGLSVRTVETHRAQLMDRLDIHDVPGLVRYALRTGMVGTGA